MRILLLSLLATFFLIGCEKNDSIDYTNSTEFNKFKTEFVQEIDTNENYIKAAHYFGDEWPINFWNSELGNLEKDFKQIKQDGFNTAIIVIPWGEFQPSLIPIRYNEDAFTKLEHIVTVAKNVDLDILLRVSYEWDFHPNKQYPNSERIMKLYSDKVVYDAWLAHLEEVDKVVSNYENVKFAFLTWEDFWPIISQIKGVDSKNNVALAEEIGYIQFLKDNYSLKEVSELYQKNFESWNDIFLPNEKERAFKLVYEYFDETVIQKFYKPASRILPNLSLEVRTDSDPIYNGDNVEWYSHKKTYDLQGSNYTTAYYSPAMGASNSSDSESAEKVLERQAHIFSDLKNNTANKIFVDQYLYYDNVPTFSHNTRIQDEELGEFIVKSSKNLEKYTGGYGVWAYKDYAANSMYNPQFEKGLEGWEIEKGEVIVKEVNGDNKAVLPKGSILKQIISKDRDFYHKLTEETQLWINIESETNSGKVLIKVDDQEFLLELNQEETYKVKFPIENVENYNLSIEALDEEIIIDDIKLFSFIQEGRLYNANGEDGDMLTYIKQLNDNLPNAIKDYGISEFIPFEYPKEYYEFSKLILKNSYPIEGDKDKKFVWVQKETEINLIYSEESEFISILGSVPYSIHQKIENPQTELSIAFYINDVLVKTQTYIEDGEINEKIKISDFIKNESGSLNLKIKTNSEVNLKQLGIAEDERDLSITIESIKVD